MPIHRDAHPDAAGNGDHGEHAEKRPGGQEQQRGEDDEERGFPARAQFTVRSGQLHSDTSYWLLVLAYWYKVNWSAGWFIH
jgi:hypothetical protein